MKRYAQQRKLLNRLIKAKAARRRELAALPVEEKIGIVITLQRLQSGILRSTGRRCHDPWRMRDSDSSRHRDETQRPRPDNTAQRKDDRELIQNG
jgi:hypothetical protein